MDPLKEAFSKVREDMDLLSSEINSIRETLDLTREELVNICEVILSLDRKITKYQEETPKNALLYTPTHNVQNQTSQAPIPTDSAHNPSFKALKGQNMVFSNGNEGVPTDRQTNQQTDQHTQNPSKMAFFEEKPTFQYLNTAQLTPESFNLPTTPPAPTLSSTSSIDHAAHILDSLDGIKKEIRLKFKRLTVQEMTVFSTIYHLEEQGIELDYKVLSSKLNLTESSVRDYVGKLIKKGIPVEKKKINNKTVLLSISANLKKIASLPTILHLRDL